MIKDYESYHGVVLREIIVRSKGPITIESIVDVGRANTFCINGRTVLHIKHCSRRLPPWQFTFNRENWSEMVSLRSRSTSFWLAFACGIDGILCLSFDELNRLSDAPLGTGRFVRVDRDRATMYRVFGNAGRLGGSRARGVTSLLDDICADGLG